MRHKYKIPLLFFTFAITAYTWLAPANPASAQALPPNKNIIDSKAIADINEFVQTEIVRLSILNQNKKYKDLNSEQIIALDNKWRAETKQESKPLISATLTNPLSTYLTRVQAMSIGLYSEMFVMDFHGLNVGQSNISSDYWQGDEAKFQKTYPAGAGAIFIDDPEYDDEKGIWNVQVNMTITDADGRTPIGAITVQINITELQRRKSASLL